jgi:ketosteroid isomerase-like protein
VTDAVQRYLAALPAHDWAALRACLAEHVERIGPYNDVYRGRDQYAQFLAETVAALPGYELVVDRIVTVTDTGAHTVLVELSETVDTPDGSRLRTAEAVVFDLGTDGLITRVAVYLRTSEHL